jgi:hypothetical protein
MRFGIEDEGRVRSDVMLHNIVNIFCLLKVSLDFFDLNNLAVFLSTHTEAEGTYITENSGPVRCSDVS